MASLIAVGFPNYLKLQNQWLLVRDWLFPRKSCKTCRSWYQNTGLGMRQVFGNPNWYQRFLLPSSLAYQSSLRPAWSIRTFLDWLSSGFEVAPSIYPTFSHHFILLPPSSLQRPKKRSLCALSSYCKDLFLKGEAFMTFFAENYQKILFKWPINHFSTKMNSSNTGVVMGCEQNVCKSN